MKQLVLLVLVSLFTSFLFGQETHIGKKHGGIYIDNGQRQGFQYTDPSGKEYSYRYVTALISNDSTVPVHVRIHFDKTNSHPCKSNTHFNVFLLPRALTPAMPQFDNGMSKALKQFLDTGIKHPVSLDTLLDPKEKCAITIGTLTSINDPDPLQLGLISQGHEYEYYFMSHHQAIKEITSKQDPLTFSFGMDFPEAHHGKKTSCYLVIPCGGISFSE